MPINAINSARESLTNASKSQTKGFKIFLGLWLKFLYHVTNVVSGELPFHIVISSSFPSSTMLALMLVYSCITPFGADSFIDLTLPSLRLQKVLVAPSNHTWISPPAL